MLSINAPIRPFRCLREDMLIHSSKKILKHTKRTTSQVIHLTLSINAPIRPFLCLREDMLIHSSKKI